MHKIVKQLQKSMLEADVVAILLEEEKNRCFAKMKRWPISFFVFVVVINYFLCYILFAY